MFVLADACWWDQHYIQACLGSLVRFSFFWVCLISYCSDYHNGFLFELADGTITVLELAMRLRMGSFVHLDAQGRRGCQIEGAAISRLI